LILDGYLVDLNQEKNSSQFNAATGDLAAGLATILERKFVSEVPDRIDLSEQLDAQARGNLRQTRRVLGLIDLVAILLSIGGGVLVGLVLLVSRSVVTTVMGGGLGLLIGGLPTHVGAER